MNLNKLIKVLEVETDKEKTAEAVFLPMFGIDADARAVAAAEKLFSKPVEPVMIPNIAADGGGLHCISWDMSY